MLWKNHTLRSAELGGLSPFTTRKETRILKGFGTWLDQEGFDKPFDVLVFPREPKSLAKALTEIETILTSINPNDPIGARIRAILLFLLDSGQRVTELSRARILDLDLERRQIRIINKGNQERIVPFGTKTRRVFLIYIHVHQPEPLSADYDHLFLSMDGIPSSRRALSRMIHRLKKSSRVERLHAHLCRHTFAVKDLLNGGDLVTPQRILGHESQEVTKRYLNLTTGQVQLRHDRLRWTA